MQIPDIIDQIYELRQKRDRIVDLYDEQIQSLRAKLSTAMKVAKVRKARGTYAQAVACQVTDVKAVDWNAIYQYIDENDAIDLLQKRLTPTAVTDRFNAGEHIPGVEISTHEEYQVRALKNRTREKEL